MFVLGQAMHLQIDINLNILECKFKIYEFD